MKLPPANIFPTITGDKISLRQIMPADIKDLVEISFYDGVQAASVQQAAEMQAKINKDNLEGNSIHWGIVNNLNNKIVGTCGYYRGFDKGAGELGFVLLPQYRGQGFMTEALLSAIKFGDNKMKLKRIWAVTHKHNKEAVKLLERLNFIKVSDLDNEEVEYELK